jgi:hypothetical protein
VNLALIARAIGIRGFIAIGFALAFAFMWWRAGVWQGRAEEQAQAAANERAAHAVTRASLSQLEQRLAAFIDDGERRSRAAQEALAEQRGRSAALGEQIARIRAQRPAAGDLAACRSPGAVLAAEGL